MESRLNNEERGGMKVVVASELSGEMWGHHDEVREF